MDEDYENIEMQDRAKKRQGEEERQEREEKEINIDWDSFYDNFDNDTPLHGSRLPGLPNLQGLDDLPSTLHERPELDKNIALEMFI